MERKLIMSHVVKIMIKTTFSNHLYKWDNKILKQTKGGAMGLKASGPLSRITMDDWMCNFKKKLEDLNIKGRLSKKYVDDVDTVVHNLPSGTRYNGTHLTRNSEDVTADEEAEVSNEVTTMNVLKEVANSIHPFLKFTSEVSEGATSPVPCLDTQMLYGLPSDQKPWFSLGLAEDSVVRILQEEDCII